MVLWTCTKCGAVKDVICPVCGQDKAGGETCVSCGSEYSHTSCPKCSYSDWHETALESETYEDKIRDILRNRDKKYLTYYELMRLASDTEPALLAELSVNDPIDVKNITQEAFSLSGTDFISTMKNLGGINEKLIQKILKLLGDVRDEGPD